MGGELSPHFKLCKQCRHKVNTLKSKIKPCQHEIQKNNVSQNFTQENTKSLEEKTSSIPQEELEKEKQFENLAPTNQENLALNSYEKTSSQSHLNQPKEKSSDISNSQENQTQIPKENDKKSPHKEKNVSFKETHCKKQAFPSSPSLFDEELL